MIDRQIFAQIWKKIDGHEILVLNGPRQVGKTTLLKQVADKLKQERGVNDEEIMFFDLEISEDLLIWSSQSSALSVFSDKQKAKKIYIFIDEFQKSKNIGSILKVIHDHHPEIKVIITGSASWYLNIDESLMGRKRVFPIWPLSFSEYLSSNEKANYLYQNLNNLNNEKIEILNFYLLKFLNYGGYPAISLTNSEDEKKKILSEIINSYILKDIQLYNLSATSLQVKNILSLLADRVGSLLDINNLSLNTELGRTALLNRLDLLTNTFILTYLRPYFTNKTKEVIKNPKIYLNDSGLRNQIMNNFSLIPKTQYFGQAIENFIMTELLKNNQIDDIYFWRGKNGLEVDFVLKKNNNIIAIEVKSGNEKNIPDGLKSFIKTYQPKNAYVLNWSIVSEINYLNTQIKFLPIFYPIDKLI